MNNELLPIQQIEALALRAGETREVAGTPYVVIPENSKVVSLENFKFHDAPRRKKATVQVLDAGSFASYYSLFHTEHSRVFADPQKLVFSAILDYHQAAGAASFCEHRLQYACLLSDEWKIWTGASGDRKSQAEFAEFIEDNAPDIYSPEAAAMVEVARDLTASTQVEFASATRLDNGQVQFRYSETVKGMAAGARIQVPEAFLIRIPVFFNDDEPVEVRARLRYRIQEGKLTMWYDLWRPDKAKEEAFNRKLVEIGASVEQSIILGFATVGEPR